MASDGGSYECLWLPREGGASQGSDVFSFPSPKGTIAPGASLELTVTCQSFISPFLQENEQELSSAFGMWEKFPLLVMLTSKSGESKEGIVEIERYRLLSEENAA